MGQSPTFCNVKIDSADDDSLDIRYKQQLPGVIVQFLDPCPFIIFGFVELIRFANHAITIESNDSGNLQQSRSITFPGTPYLDFPSILEVDHSGINQSHRFAA